jgi:3-deoxy-D-manno-octulosonic acid kinase
MRLRIHSHRTVPEREQEELVQICTDARSTDTMGVSRISSPLGGRGNVRRVHLNGFGPLVMKGYSRGGLFRHLISDRYFSWGASRSEREYDLLMYVRQCGVPVPEPLVSLTERRVVYRCWLVSEEIQDHQTLATLSTVDIGRAARLITQVLEYLYILIEHRIHHLDLHPGNVVIDPRDGIYFIDFDKASRFEGSREKLRMLYERRWRRAVIKHRLPETLSELMCLGLQRKNWK